MSYDPAQGGQGWQQQPPGYPPPGAGFGQQPGWGPPPGPGGGYGGAPPAQKSPFSALFDLSFTTFATPALIKLLYIMGMVLLGIAWIGYTIVGFTVNAGLGLLALVLGGVLVLFYLAFLRLMMEFFFAVVRMSEDIHKRP
jgi:hypothetical protein